MTNQVVGKIEQLTTIPIGVSEPWSEQKLKQVVHPPITKNQLESFIATKERKSEFTDKIKSVIIDLEEYTEADMGDLEFNYEYYTDLLENCIMDLKEVIKKYN